MEYQYNPIYMNDEEFDKVKKFYDGLENLAERTPKGEMVEEGMPERFWGYDNDREAYLTRIKEDSVMMDFYLNGEDAYFGRDREFKATDEQIEEYISLLMEENKKISKYVDYFSINSAIIYEYKAYLTESKTFNSLEECIEFVKKLKNQGYVVFLMSLSLRRPILDSNQCYYKLRYIAINQEEVN